MKRFLSSWQLLLTGLLLTGLIVLAMALVPLTKPSRARPRIWSGGELVNVWVARVNIPPGVLADYAARKGWFEGRFIVDQRSIQPGAIHTLSEIAHKVALASIPKGSEILGQEFAAPSPASPG